MALQRGLSSENLSSKLGGFIFVTQRNLLFGRSVCLTADTWLNRLNFLARR